ncbi:NNMT/PNMT/TEMT family protein [Cooperia oncophora]
MITLATMLFSGPTVYLPIAFRDRAAEIYTSDYAQVNRDVLQSWIENKSSFDWSNVCDWIASIEACGETPSRMQQTARGKMKAVLEVDVQKTPVIQGVHWQREGSKIPEKFQLQGGVTDATTYNFGGKVFKCHRLQRSHIEESLEENGMSITAEDGYKFITHEDIFLLVSKKIR